MVLTHFKERRLFATLSSMHTILCYGDSNTFGTNPSGGRWSYDQRWTGLLSSLLGPECRIIEEGLGGRTTVFDDPLEEGRCGKAYLPIALSSHRPLDLVILSLGTNDCKHFFSANERIIAKGLEILSGMILNHPYGDGYPIPKVLVVSPIVIGEEVERSGFAAFDADSVLLSRKLGPAIKAMADRQGLLSFDAASVASPSTIDQLHMDRESHAALAEALAPIIRSLFALHEEEKGNEEPEKQVHRPLRFPFLKR